MDVLITPAARLEIEALRACRPGPSAWAVLLGHARGFRFIVEQIFPAGTSRPPDERALAGLETVWPGRVIGLLAVLPGAALKKALLGPAWYGKLVLVASGSVKKPVLRSYVVEFGRRFFLVAVPFAPPVKEEIRE
jgi:hypothetical protein